MRKFIFSLVFGVAALGGWAQGPYEINGLWYDNVKNGMISIVPKPDGSQYFGRITIPQKVNLPTGEELFVNPTVANDVFKSSMIEEVVMNMPQVQTINGRTYGAYISFAENKVMKRLQFNQPMNLNNWTTSSNINTGNNPNVVNCYVRETEDGYDIIVDKFNIFDSQGKQMKPCIMYGFDRPGQLLYPDEHNAFHLDKNFCYTDYEYTEMVRTEEYYVINLHGEDESGNIVQVRTQPEIGHTGIETTINGLIYGIEYNSAIVKGCIPDLLSPEFIVPSQIEYMGKSLPVTKIGVGAFDNSKIKKITLPSTIEEVKGCVFGNCPYLEEVDMSQTTVNRLASTFENCPALNKVEVPVCCLSYSYVFEDCPSLKYFSIPDGSTCTTLVYRNTGLFNIEYKWTENEELQIELKHFGITYKDGYTPVFYPYNYYSHTDSDTWDAQYEWTINKGKKVGNVYTFPRSAFFDPYNPDTFKSAIYWGDYEDPKGWSTLKQTTYAVTYVTKPDDASVTLHEVNGLDAPVEYYNMQGLRIKGTPGPGLYIRRQGGKCSKVLIK